MAIDFETADYGADSACALAMVTIDSGRIVDRVAFMIRPPRRQFVFTYIHGIEWEDVRDAPIFAEIAPLVSKKIEESDYVAAHNAAFDRKVLLTCFVRAGFQPPEFKTVCTVRLAKKSLGFTRASLPVVCARLGIELNHHEAMSDANACAEILVEAIAKGASLSAATLGRPTYTVV